MQGRRPYDHPLVAQLGRLAERMAGVERRPVRPDDQVLAGKFDVDPLQGRFNRPAVHPRDKTQGEKVLGAVGVPGFHAEVLTGLFGEAGHRHPDDLVAVEVVGGQGVVVVAGLVQVTFVKGVGVDDQRASGHQSVQFRLEGGRVHGHQNLWRVARGGDVVIRDLDLEGGHPGQGAGRGTDLGRKVRKGRQVVAGQRAGIGEPVTGELHAVARVAGEADDDPFDLV